MVKRLFFCVFLLVTVTAPGVMVTAQDDACGAAQQLAADLLAQAQIALDQGNVPLATGLMQSAQHVAATCTDTTAADIPFFPLGSRNTDWTPVVQDFDGVEMVLVPAGCFLMGSTDEQIEDVLSTGGRRSWYEHEQPAHVVCFAAPFWIDRTEVTNGQYGSSGEFTGDNRPRERVTFYAARQFCAQRDARLPTEAEWEYAARGSEGWLYPWGNEFDTSLVVEDARSTVAVGSKPDGASWVGALDMSGSVWEWVADWYDEAYYSTLASVEINPTGPHDTGYGVIRGGSWYTKDTYTLRAANRTWTYHDAVNGSYGFRCVRDVEDLE